MYDVIIIGAGPAGLSAGLYCGRYKLNTLIIGHEKGGLIVEASSVENWPGFKKITGYELAKKLEEQVKDLGIETKTDLVKKLEKKKDYFLIKTEKNEFEAKSLILALGSNKNKLNVKGESEFSGKGIHYCVVCDAPLYKDKIVGVVGGGDSATKAALLLSEYAKKVYIFVKEENMKAEPANIEKVMKNRRIEVMNNVNINEIKGDKFIGSISLDKKKEIKLDGLFIEIGNVPASKLALDLGIKINNKNEIIVDKEMKTNVKGVYAAGDVTDNKLKQAITASAEGVIASNSAYKFVKGLKGL